MPEEKNFFAQGRVAVFRHEWLQLWRSLPMRWEMLALLGLWAALFHFLGNSTLGYVNTRSLFGWWFWVHTRGWENPDGSLDFSRLFAGDEEAHAWFIPLVVLVLFWCRRDELMAMTKRVWWPALGVFIAGLLLHVLGYMVQQTRISVAGFFLGIYGLTGLFWGGAWMRVALFPFALFAFCVPLGNSAEYITFPLRMLVTKLSVWIANVGLGIDVIRDGSRIFDAQRTFQYDVAPACSGIRSLVTLLALTTIFGFLSFQKNWKRGLMVFMAFPLAVAGNTLRITCVIVAGEAFGQQAGAKIEQNLGLLTFALALGTVLLMAHWLREDKAPKDAGAALHLKSLSPVPAKSVEPESTL